MTTPQSELARVLSSYADAAELPRVDLLGIVEGRYRRRRVTRNAVMASALVITVAVLVGFSAFKAGLGPKGSQPASHPHPTQQSYLKPFSQGTWKAPKGRVPDAQSVWPVATFTLPAKAPDGGTLRPMTSIDSNHVLLESSPKFEATGSFYSYDLVTGALRPMLAQVPGKQPIYVNRVVVTPHYLVWEVDGKSEFTVYKAPLAGGGAQLVATVAEDSGSTGPWFGTDSAVYWSGKAPGVKSLSLSGGTVHAVSGFENMRVVDASGWTVHIDGPAFDAPPDSGPMVVGEVTTSLKNLLTGTTVHVNVPHGAENLACTPAFCIGSSGGHGFIQKPDGSDLVALPENFDQDSVMSFGGAGLVISVRDAAVAWDPIGGNAGAISASPIKGGGYETFGICDIIGVMDGKTNTWTFLALGAIH